MKTPRVFNSLKIRRNPCQVDISLLNFEDRDELSFDLGKIKERERPRDKLLVN
jgi:hypothetical protein